jgi:hypothetical protein
LRNCPDLHRSKARDRRATPRRPERGISPARETGREPARRGGGGDRCLRLIFVFAILAETEISHGHFQAQCERIEGPGRRSARPLTQPAVLITKHGRPRNVVLSCDESERLRARDRRAVRAEDLTDEDIAALEASEMAPGVRSISTPSSRRNEPGAEGRLAAELRLSVGRRPSARRGRGVKYRPCAVVPIRKPRSRFQRWPRRVSPSAPGSSAARPLAGPDLRSAAGRTPPSIWYGPLPPKLATAARQKPLGYARACRLGRVPRTE